MRAWQLVDAKTSTLELSEVPTPQPAAGEVLVRVQAAGITPAELAWYPTTHLKSGSARERAVPGHEFSGTIASMGRDVTGLIVGQEIYGMNEWFADGAAAEYCLTRPEWISAKPKRLTHAQTASIPISALTAWQGLAEKASLKAGERVLVHGGSGGVGTLAVQLARRMGARVITTASARNAEFLRGLGAERVIDYHTERFEESIKDIDVVFDTVGGTTLGRSWGVLSARGRVVTIASANESAADERTKKAFFIVDPKGEQLVMFSGWLDSGELLPVVDAIVPFAEAGRAYAGKEIQTRSGRGKTVVTMLT